MPSLFSRCTKSKPFDFKRQTDSFIYLIGALLFAVVGVYLVLHYIFLPNELVYRGREFVDINAHGHVTIKSSEDIDWFVGSRKSVPLLQGMESRNKQILENQSRLDKLMSELSSRLPPGASDNLRALKAAIQRGDPGALAPPSPLPSGSFLRMRSNILARLGVGTGIAYTNQVTTNQSAALLQTLERLSVQLTNQVQGYEAWRSLQTVLTNALLNLGSISNLLKVAAPTNQATSQALNELAGVHDLIWQRIHLNANLYGPTNPLAAIQSTVLDLNEVYQPPEKATLAFARLARELTEEARTRVGGALLADIEAALHRAEVLRAEQAQSISSLRRPEKYALFWMTPSGSIAEVVFWAWFGALTSILVRASEARWRQDFRPSREMTSYVMLIYAPMVAVAIALAIINGLVSLLGEEVRVWTLPLLGFLFGYHARRTASLVDKLGQRVLGKAFESMDKSAAERGAPARASEDKISSALPPPQSSLADVQTLAQQKAEQVIYQLVSNLDNRR